MGACDSKLKENSVWVKFFGACGGLRPRYARVGEATGVLPENYQKTPHPPWLALPVAGATWRLPAQRPLTDSRRIKMAADGWEFCTCVLDCRGSLWGKGGVTIVDRVGKRR